MAVWPPGGLTPSKESWQTEDRPVACGEGRCEGHLCDLLGTGCQQTDEHPSAAPGERTIREREIKNPNDQAPSHLHTRN